MKQCEAKGYNFEFLLGTIIEENYCKKYGWKLITNIEIPRVNTDKTTQIDMILFTPYSYFCIEAKNWSCDIECSSKRTCKVIYPEREIRVINPLHQNLYHIQMLSNIVTRNKIKNIVCFSESTNIRNKIKGFYNISDFLKELDKLEYCNKVISEETMKTDYTKLAIIDLERSLKNA